MSASAQVIKDARGTQHCRSKEEDHPILIKELQKVMTGMQLPLDLKGQGKLVEQGIKSMR